MIIISAIQKGKTFLCCKICINLQNGLKFRTVDMVVVCAHKNLSIFRKWGQWAYRWI